MNENTFVDSFFLLSLRALCLIVFHFCLHFCTLSHFEITRRTVKSLIATWAPKPVYWSLKWPEYVTNMFLVCLFLDNFSKYDDDKKNLTLIT